MNVHLRRAALELAAGVVEELHAELLQSLYQDAGPLEPARARAGEPIVYTDERDLPQPEEGDRLAGLQREAAIREGKIPPADGIYDQDGYTEEEWQHRRELEEGP